MRKNFGTKPWVYPQPVLIVATYDEEGKANAMNAAWGGQYDTDQIMISLGAHKTTENIRAKGAFTVSFATVQQLAAADYVGIVSANDVPDKLERAGFHTVKSAFVDAPLIEELPMALECELQKFNEDGILVGKIVNVSADESILNDDGKIDPQKLNAIVFDPVNAAYLRLGEKVGNAFHDGLR